MLQGVHLDSHHLDVYKEIKLKSTKVKNLFELLQLDNTMTKFESLLYELHDSGRISSQIGSQYILEINQLFHAAKRRLNQAIWN